MTFLQQLMAAPVFGTVNDERLWSSWDGGPMTAAGMAVTHTTALKISTVWACVGLLADCVAMLPAIIYERKPDDSRQRATSHPLYDVIHDQPNDKHTAFEFKNMMQGHLLLRGNALAKILPGPRGPADQLKPVHPDKVRIVPLVGGGTRYMIRDDDGVERPYNDEDILHIKGLTLDGQSGLSVVAYARESMGLALAGEQSGARTFSNGSRPSGLLKTPGKLSKDGGKRIKESWQSAQAGVENTGRVAVLEEGLEWQAIGLNNKDTQWLESREFQAEDICRWFRVPPHMVGLTSKATSWGTGLEQMSVGFVTYTLMPWLVRWQQAISRDLIIAPKKYFIEFLVDALLKSDLQSRYNAYAIARNWGWLSVNDIRRKENENPIEGGDTYLEPLNMKDASEPDKPPASIPPAPPPAPMPMPGNNGDNAHYRQLLYESAGRIVRKEIAFLSRLNNRIPEQSTEWLREVMEFYDTHGPFVAKTLKMDVGKAEQYAANRVRELTDIGTGELATWEQHGAADLVEMALHG